MSHYWRLKTNPLSEGGAMTTLGRSRVREGLWLVRRCESCSFIGWNFGRSSVNLQRSICTMLCLSLHNQIIDKNFLTLLDTLAHLKILKNVTSNDNYSNSHKSQHQCKLFTKLFDEITTLLQYHLKMHA